MWKNISLSLFSCIIIISLLEITLQILDYPHYESEVRVGWYYQGSDTIHLNQLQYRGRKIAYDSADKVVLLLGDSQVEADGCAFEQMPERYLEKSLQTWLSPTKVFSVGAGGYGTDQELLALKRYFKQYRADLILVWITPSNDVWNNLFPTHIPKDGLPKPTYRLENQQLKGPKFKLDSLVMENSPLKLIHLWQRIFKNPLKGIDENWVEQTMPASYQVVKEYKGEYLDWTNHKIENLINEKAHTAIQFSPTSERMRYGIRLTQKLFEEIVKTAEQNKAKAVFFYRDEYPELPHDNATGVIKQNDRFFFISKPQYRENISALTHTVNAVYLPLLIKDWRAKPEDGHLNTKANEKVMQMLSDSLQIRLQRK